MISWHFPIFFKKFKKISSTKNGGGQEDNDVLLTRNWWISAKSLSSPSSSFTCWPYRNIILIPTISCCGHFNRRKKALDVERRGPPGPFISSIVSPLLKHPPPKKKKNNNIFFRAIRSIKTAARVERETTAPLFFGPLRKKQNCFSPFRRGETRGKSSNAGNALINDNKSRETSPGAVHSKRNGRQSFEIFSVRKCCASLNWLPNEMIKCH